MASNVFGAIEEQFSASSTLPATVPGGLWTSIAPEGTRRPYSVLQHVSSHPKFCLGKLYTESQIFRLHAFSESAAEVMAAMRDIESTIDWTKPAVFGTNEQVIAVRRTNSVGPFTEEDNPSTWHGVVEYEITLQRELP